MIAWITMGASRIFRRMGKPREELTFKHKSMGVTYGVSAVTTVTLPSAFRPGVMSMSASTHDAVSIKKLETSNSKDWLTTEELMAEDNAITQILKGCQKAGVHVLLEGRPGISKSTTAIKLAVELVGQDKVASIVLPEDTPVAELRGFYMPNDEGKFKWVDGPITRMIRVGGIAILDELSHLSPEAQTFMHAALDDSPITLPTGETVTKHTGFWCVATQNDSADMLRDALKDRFPVRLKVSQPPATVYEHLPEELRTAAKNQVEGEKGSLRPWFAFARLRATIGDDQAAELIWPGRGAAMLAALKLAKAA